MGLFQFSDERLWVMTVTWGLVVLANLLIAALVRSPGAGSSSPSEDEDAARSLGKNVVAFKMQSLVIGGVIGGAAGIMAVLRSSAANSDSFGTEITFFAYTILILGGAATKWGPSSGRPSSGS